LNANRTLEAAHAALAGALPFPEIVRQLIANGVEYYFVDFVSKSFTFYSAAGAVSLAPLSIDDLPAVASEFNAPALRAAILDSQQNGLKYRAFCRRAVEAGVQSYFAFLRGQRVVYIGRQGDQHTEWFHDSRPGSDT
jgi:uncharacterized protein YbcV (DUF1398 family)